MNKLNPVCESVLDQIPVVVTAIDLDCAPGLDSLGADLYEAWNASFIEQIFIC